MEDIDFVRVFDALPGLVWTAFPDGRADFVNQRWCEYTGLSFDEARGDGWQDAVHSDDRPRLVEAWIDFTRSGRAGELEARLRRFDGEFRWFLFRFCPLADSSGKIAKWCGINTDIEDRVRAEQAQRALDQRAQLILDGLPAHVIFMTANGKLEGANQYSLNYFGKTLQELKSQEVGHSYHPDDRAEVLALWRRSVESGEPCSFEARSRRSDGVYRWLHTLGFPLRDAEGRIAVWYILSLDVTDRRASEERLRQANDYLREAQRIGQTGSFTWDVLADDHSWSDEVYRIFGVDADVRVNVALLQTVIHPDDLPEVGRVIGDAAQGRNFDLVFRIVGAGGALKYAHAVAHPIENRAGRPLFLGSIQDITERKIAEDKLRISSAYLAEAQRVSSTGSFFWRVASGEIIWSDQVFHMFGYEPGSEMSLERIGARVHPEDTSMLKDMVERAARGEAELEYEHRVVMPDGAIKHLHLIARIRGEPGSVEYIGAVQDITERRRTAEALDDVRSQLARVARVTALGTLTASIAHEVNQPLSGIITNVNTCLRMLSAEPPNVAGAQETARRAVRDGNRAAEIIKRLRALFARRRLAREPVNLNEATQEVIALSWSDLQRRHVSMRSNLASDLPTVFGDRVQLQQVILNLLMNAAEAMSEVEVGSRHMSITTQREDAGQVSLAVRDAGSGFAPGSAERVFEAFYTTKDDGTGIGLSISRSIIETHGGRLSVHPNDGPGVTFVFTLPSDA